MADDLRDMEREANIFAMELLMPEAFLRADIPEGGVDVLDEVAVGKLAKRYRVPAVAMAARLLALELSH